MREDLTETYTSQHVPEHPDKRVPCTWWAKPHVMAGVEHRWYAFSGLEMALFVDAGKTVPEKGRINFSELNYSGGIGLRARVRGAVVLRMQVITV